MIDFDYVYDSKLKFLLERDFKELQICLECRAYKSVLILCGSIIEATLVDYFLENMPDTMTKGKILKLGLSDLIDLAFDNKLISQKSKDLSSVIRNYRNLIHPGVELRKNENFDLESAQVAKNLVVILLREIRENNLKVSGYKAIDIITKFETDNLSYSIAEKLIEKLSNNEKVRLFELISIYDLNNRNEFNIHPIDTKAIIQILKPLVPREFVLRQLKVLLNKVEQGEQWEIMNLYHLFHDSLDILVSEEREIVNLYVMNIFSHHSDDAEKMKEYEQKKMVVSIGKQIETEKEKAAFFDLIEKVVINWKKDRIVYFQIVEALLHEWSGIGKK